MAILCEEERDDPQLLDSERDIETLLTDLAAWSMISLAGDRFTIHRLVQDTTRCRIPEEKRPIWLQQTFGLLDKYIPADPPSFDVRSWSFWEASENHVRAAIAHATDEDIAQVSSRPLNELGLYYKARARFSEAEPLYQRALAIDEASLGADHPKVALRLNNLALLLQDTNRLAEAEPLYRRALIIFEKSLGKDHPYSKTVRQNIE